MTALVLVSTGFHVNPDGLEGTQLTAAAFESILPWFPYILVICIFLFAFSTMISWSYYGLKGSNFLFGRYFQKYTGKERTSDLVYYLLFLACIVIGASSSLTAVIDFSDMMILGMAFPNIVGLLFLSGEVSRDLKDYLKRLKSGDIARTLPVN
jgi:AGCS family alanine or glycine:cation symporter